MLYYLRADRVEDNVSRYFKEVALFLDKDRLESPLEDVPRTLVSPVERLCVNTVQVSHATREIRPWRLDQEVIMIRHQAVCVTDPAEAFYHITEYIQGAKTIFVVEEDLLSGIPTGCNMVNSPFKLNPQWPGHKKKYSQSEVKKQDLTPYLSVAWP
jgi:hypothetical protein